MFIFCVAVFSFMGLFHRMSVEERRELERKELERFVNGLAEAPDVKVNTSIVKFCSLASSDNLKQHYEERKTVVGERGAEWIKSLVEKLGNLTPAPALAGLGALAIAVFIDIMSFSPEESTMDILRSVFAEEKASEIWDQIDECLKRCRMNINNSTELRRDIRRIEPVLSTALTKLKNSMVRDGQMSNPALKAWVNGAAFHIQMLIHLVRLGGIQTCDPVKNLLSVYEKDLDTLFEKHREMVESKCSKDIMLLPLLEFSLNVQLRVLLPFFQLPGDHAVCLVDEDSKPHTMSHFYRYDQYLEAYYNHRYMRQKREIQQHFREVEENLQSLVQRIGFFNLH